MNGSMTSIKPDSPKEDCDAREIEGITNLLQLK